MLSGAPGQVCGSVSLWSSTMTRDTTYVLVGTQACTNVAVRLLVMLPVCLLALGGAVVGGLALAALT